MQIKAKNKITIRVWKFKNKWILLFLIKIPINNKKIKRNNKIYLKFNFKKIFKKYLKLHRTNNMKNKKNKDKKYRSKNKIKSKK
jgi:hypothetical protein